MKMKEDEKIRLIIVKSFFLYKKSNKMQHWYVKVRTFVYQLTLLYVYLHYHFEVCSALFFRYVMVTDVTIHVLHGDMM